MWWKAGPNYISQVFWATNFQWGSLNGNHRRKTGRKGGGGGGGTRVSLSFFKVFFDADHFKVWASQVALLVKIPTANAEDIKRRGFDPWVGKIPWRRAWKPTPVFLPGESPGQKSLKGYSPRGSEELDTTEVT